MARDAKAAGDDREAAQFLDNIAIIDRCAQTGRARGKIERGQGHVAARLTPKPPVDDAKTPSAAATQALVAIRQSRAPFSCSSRFRTGTPPEPDLRLRAGEDAGARSSCLLLPETA